MVACRIMLEYLLGERDNDRLYFDHNATTPVAKTVSDKIPTWLEAWGNPSSIHQSGRGPKSILRQSRQSLALMLGCQPLELVFTSGGSEANNMALKGVFSSIHSGRMDRPGRDQYICSSVEHPSVMKAMQYLAEKHNAQLDVVPVSRQGELDMDKYQSLLSERTALVSIMFANNETGNIFPIKKLSKKAHEVGALFHCDGVQALGKVPFQMNDWGVDLASFSAHKFYALKGCGVLYAKQGVVLESLIHGGGQERNRRAGTENILSIAAFGEMASYKDKVLQMRGSVCELRDLLEQTVVQTIEGVRVTGKESKRLPNTSSLVIDGVDGETLLMNLDMQGISVSTGAACSAGSPEPSPVLLAMGLSRWEAQGSLRVSLGWGGSKQQVHQFVETLERVVSRLRKIRSQIEAEATTTADVIADVIGNSNE